MFVMNLRYRFGVIIKITQKTIHLRCDIPFKTKFISLNIKNVCVESLCIGESVEITYHYTDEFSLELDSILKASIDACSRCFSFKNEGTECNRCNEIREIDTKLRLEEPMRLIASELKRGYHLTFVDKHGYILRTEPIYRINPLFNQVKDLVVNKSYEVIAWQKYSSSWFIEVIVIIDRGYIF